MRELISKYPLFSYIAVPFLLIVLLVLIYYVVKPRSTVRDHFSGLYSEALAAIDYIGGAGKKFGKSELKHLIKMLAKMKHYYEMLESDELYEVEGIINNINKAIMIARALIVSGSNDVKIADFTTDIATELNGIRTTLYAFTLSRESGNIDSFSVIGSLNIKNNKKRANQYLDSIKQAKD